MTSKTTFGYILTINENLTKNLSSQIDTFQKKRQLKLFTDYHKFHNANFQ